MAVKSNDSTVGWILVGAQFALIGLLVGLIFLNNPMHFIGHHFISGSVILSGVALFAFTQYFNRPGNWSVHPLPKRGGQLVTGGPYGLIRHPMYTAALLSAAGAALWTLNWLSLVCMLALVVVFVLKINIEERELATKFPGWAEYTSRTKRLIPNVW